MRSSAHRGTSTVSLQPSSPACALTYSFFPDNLQVQWGSQDHYEIVRKVGRGKYSEVRFFRI
jgi:hypothetical protein